MVLFEDTLLYLHADCRHGVPSPILIQRSKSLPEVPKVGYGMCGHPNTLLLACSPALSTLMAVEDHSCLVLSQPWASFLEWLASHKPELPLSAQLALPQKQLVLMEARHRLAWLGPLVSLEALVPP